MSYVRADDDHDAGNITNLRRRLEGELEMQLGAKFPIFQDRNDISWGDAWDERIKNSLLEVTFLMPIITPRFFKSHACRSEFEIFLLRERQLGLNRLILPIYYVEAVDLTSGKDEIAGILKHRHYSDWRELRFHSHSDPVVLKAVADMATTVKSSMKELEIELEAARKPPPTTRSRHAAKAITKAAAKDLKSPMPAAKEVSLIPFSSDVAEAAHLLMQGDGALLPGYYAFTKKHDEIVTPLELGSPEELFALQKFIAPYTAALLEDYRSELAGFVGQLIPRKNDRLTLLLDNSGSLRGDKIAVVAAWMSILADISGSAGMEVEILGFTTRAWKGGQSREEWLAAGKPEKPGRLNDLRHVIYKRFDQSIVEAANNYSIMAREGLLKENIDGEAILWAIERLVKKEGRKFLIVISDGAPVDDSTLAANDGSFLERHLRDVIKYVSEKTDVTLHGVGIGHDVSRYFPHASLVPDNALRTLGNVVLETIVNLVRAKNKRS